MNSIVQPGYQTRTCGNFVKSSKTTQPGAQNSRFLDMAIQASEKKAVWPAALQNSLTGTTFTPINLTVHSAREFQTTSAESTEAPSLETMLKAKYPNLVYHVFDASGDYWKTRNDYPHYLLYQSGDKAAKTLENWQPEGANPFYGSVDGRFIAPKEIHALSNVPPGSKAVVIHPTVQKRMEQDPKYASEIFTRIDTWFAFDVARNEAILPGCTVGMSQAVAIGEDGNICNAVSSSSGGEFTYSSDEMVRAYYLRMAKRADFMRWLTKKQRSDSIRDSVQEADLAEAKSRLAKMMEDERLQEILGEKIAGIPTETVLFITKTQVWGN